MGEHYETDSEQLAQFLYPRLETFRGVYSANELDRSQRALGWPSTPPHTFILNTDTTNLPGQHWIAVFVTRENWGEVFDSYGLLPPTWIQRWMNEYTRGWSHNPFLVQPPNSNSCGQFCVYFLIRRSQANSMHAVLDSFTTDFKYNERLVLSYYRS
jgi:hypothetical protein